jgi:hypothetical protein
VLPARSLFSSIEINWSCITDSLIGSKRKANEGSSGTGSGAPICVSASSSSAQPEPNLPTENDACN